MIYLVNELNEEKIKQLSDKELFRFYKEAVESLYFEDELSAQEIDALCQLKVWLFDEFWKRTFGPEGEKQYW